MDQELELPPLRAVTPLNNSRPSFLRKRSRRSSNSSDVPVFSSDDLAEATSENYVSPRPKKQHRGTWWVENAGSTRRRRNKPAAKKFLDSGVWLSSDSSTDDGFSVDALRLNGSAAAQNLTSPGKKAPLITPEILAQKIIQDCLESGRETVDLTSSGLTNLSNDIVRPLHHLIRQPNVDFRIEEAYHSFQPSIQLFLGSNQLYTLPSEMFNLRNITVLSLRNTRITKLPQTIGNLVNLKELNIAGNELRWLPWEILDLVKNAKLTTIYAWPNPYFQPFPHCDFLGHRWVFGSSTEFARSSIAACSERLAMLRNIDPHSPGTQNMTWVVNIHKSFLERMAQFENDNPGWLGGSNRPVGLNAPRAQLSQANEEYLRAWKNPPLYIASSSASLLGPDGSALRSSEVAPSNLPRNVAVLQAASPETVSISPVTPEKYTGARSLFELALQMCTNSPFFDELKDYLPLEAPETVERALDVAHLAKGEGGRSCSVCKRNYIVPRSEWIEYWHVGATHSGVCPHEELFLPFLRRGCSWECR